MVPFYHFSNKTQFLTTETHKKNYIKTTTHKPNILYFDSSAVANSNANTWGWQIHHGRKNNSNLGDILANCDILKCNVWKTGLLLLIFFDKKNSPLLLKNDGLGNPTWIFSYWGVFISVIHRLREKGGRGANLPPFFVKLQLQLLSFYFT